MCGINGFTFNDIERVQKMNAVLEHRGPDQTDYWCSDGISLGHDRLAIIDLSERGKQPMFDAEKRFSIVFNGEIYNFQEIRKELESKYTFVSGSDTEVILYAYREYGANCLHKFNGIFAFAIWDALKKELFIARDQMGIKPLYYAEHDGKLYFSSEIKGLLAAGVPRTINKEAVPFYFNLLYIPEPQTLFKGVYKLPAAHFGRWKDGHLETTRYFEIADFTNYTDYSLAVHDIKEIFDDSVKHQLISDRPVGVFLSGGLDSTAVLGAVMKQGRGAVKTFSIGFDVEIQKEKFNADALLAKQTAKVYGTDHYEYTLSAKDVVDNLRAIAWHLDQPNFNPTAAAIFVLSREAKKDVAVVLGGDGADELFGGYPRYYYSRLLSLYQKAIPSLVRLPAAYLLRALRYPSLAEKSSLPPGARRVMSFLSQKPFATQSFLQPAFADQRQVERHFSERYFGTILKDDFEKQFMNLDRQSWLVDESLTRTDAMTMAFGLEERVPILDRRLVELAYKIPTSWKINVFKNSAAHFQGKDIWREAIGSYLPKHVLDQEKRGWFTPMSKWLRADLKPLVDELLSPANLDPEFFDVAGVQVLWQNHLSGKQYNLNSIWALVMWQMWYNVFFKVKRL
jgi:asparagine synthase (glutamine-hydrolysing)